MVEGLDESGEGGPGWVVRVVVGVVGMREGWHEVRNWFRGWLVVGVFTGYYGIAACLEV